MPFTSRRRAEETTRLRRAPRAAFAGFVLVAAVATVVAGASRASATPPPVIAAPAPDASGTPAPQGGDFFTGIKRRETLLGDIGGIRSKLSRYGISLAASETSEELGNVGGGTRRGFVYDGLLQMDVQLDTQRAFGLRGGTVNVSALQIHGHNLSASNLGSLQTASGIEADQASRLWELWYDQTLSRNGKFDVKIGEQSLDQEFMVNQNASVFVNTMFGWPMLPSANLPGGGPAYPLAALGVRFRAKPTNAVTLLGGVFNGSPTTSAPGDPQRTNASGTAFPLGGGVLAIGEIQYATPALGGIVYADRPEPHARTIKLGFWYDSQTFADLAVDSTGVPLASPMSNGIARPHQGNYAAYATIDQVLAQNPDDPFKSVNGFGRAMATPLGAQNLIAFSFDGGIVVHEPIKRRRDDTLALGLGYTKVGSGAAFADRTAGTYGGTAYPVRNGEAFLEASYQYQLYPWIALQPDVQYTITPGAGIPNPANPTTRIGNEPVIGLRAVIQL
jgi:porin